MIISFKQLSKDERGRRIFSLLNSILAKRVEHARNIAMNHKLYLQIKVYIFVWEHGENIKKTNTLGEGDQGMCYSSEFFGKKVVVKHLKELSEANLITEISWLHNIWCIGHPNIVPPVTLNDGEVVIFLDDHGVPTITMEEIQGRSVDETDFATWTTFDKIWAFVQLADCLNMLHKYGLFHSDLHRMNIIIRNDKTPIIIDLGTITTIEEYRKMDVNSLFELIIDFKLDEDTNCPPMLKKWGQDFCEGNRNSLPGTIEEVCSRMGNMSIGTLVTLTNNGCKAVYPCQFENGALYISFCNDSVGFEDYAMEVIGPNFRARQQKAIHEYLSNSGSFNP